jgi:hypothetical protein
MQDQLPAKSARKRLVFASMNNANRRGYLNQKKYVVQEPQHSRPADTKKAFQDYG